jgi:hypothetical protein
LHLSIRMAHASRFFRPHIAVTTVAAGVAMLLTGVTGSVRAQTSAAELPFKLEKPRIVRADVDLGDRPRHLGRAVLETAAVLTGGLVWYWRDLDFNTRDWDLRWDRESWKRKLTSLDAVRFDQNLFQTNAVSHARAGVAHYQILRGNGYGAGASTLGTLATSAIWEYLIEFKELISLNDLVVNTVSGFGIGEPFYQLGEFFLRSSPSLFSRGMATGLSPIASVNDWVDGRNRSRGSARGWGFPRDAWHRFELTGGFATRTFDRDTDRNEMGLGLAAELVNLPQYLRPGTLDTWTRPGAFTAVEAQLELSDRRNAGGSFRSRATMAGHYAQRYQRHADGEVNGWSRLLALGSSFEYEEVERPVDQDYLAVMNVLGPVAELSGAAGGVQVRWLNEVYGNFALVKSLGMEGRMPVLQGPIYHPADSGGTIPGVLGARGYYYALGLSAATRLVLEYSGWDAGVEWRGNRFTSISGFDRFQEEIRSEIHLADRRAALRTHLGVQPWATGPRLQAVLDWRWRDGRAGELAVEHLDRRFTVAMSYVF